MPLHALSQQQHKPKGVGAPNMTQLSPEKAQAYWSRTSGLMWTMLAIWFLASFVVHLFAPSLNGIRILGFPLGFYMAAQGSLIIFVVMHGKFARRHESLLKIYTKRQNGSR